MHQVRKNTFALQLLKIVHVASMLEAEKRKSNRWNTVWRSYYGHGRSYTYKIFQFASFHINFQLHLSCSISMTPGMALLIIFASPQNTKLSTSPALWMNSEHSICCMNVYSKLVSFPLYQLRIGEEIGRTEVFWNSPLPQRNWKLFFYIIFIKNSTIPGNCCE